MTGRIVQISVSAGGVPKRPVSRARVLRSGLEGDAHRDAEHHGGPDRALCLFSLEQIEALQAEGHPVEPGALGENLTIAGLDWERVEPETFFRIGGRGSRPDHAVHQPLPEHPGLVPRRGVLVRLTEAARRSGRRTTPSFPPESA